MGKPKLDDRMSPNISDIYVAGAAIGHPDMEPLSDTEFRVLMRLVFQAGVRSVWTYTAPNGGILPKDHDQLRRLARVSPQTWRKVWPQISEFFVERKDGLHLAESWLCIAPERNGRLPMSQSRRDQIADRDGRRCRYCGTHEGPFDIDHVVPIARGGGEDDQNLVLACAPCNRSKGAKLLREWKP